MSALEDIHKRQAKYLDAMTAGFREHLQEIVTRGTAHATAVLSKKLTITNGVIDQTPANLKLLRNANELFMREINAVGYERLVDTFTGEFPRQLPFLQETIEYLGEQVKEPWPPLKFRADDLNVFDAFRLNTVSSLETIMEQAAGTAMMRGMFSVGGLKFADLVETLAGKLQQSVPRAVTIADTSMSIFFRTMGGRAYAAIQEGQKKPLKYEYSGPDDAITRDFCRELVEADESYTLDQIAEMDNEQFPVGSVFLTCGGHNCRHAWLLDTSEWEAMASAAQG